MFAKKIINRICSVLWVMAFTLSLVQPAYAAPVEASRAVAAPEMLQFTSGGHVLRFSSGGMLAATGSHALRVDFVNANPVQPQSDTPTSSKGQAAALGQVTYINLWDGINLDYRAGAGSIYTTTYQLAPGANPADIRLHYNVPLTLNRDGTLGIIFKTGKLSESAPVAWQDINGNRVMVSASFQVEGQDVSFKQGAYDPAYALTIDPSLVWSTFLGGSEDEWGYGIDLDSSGNMYVAGNSYDTWGSPIRAYWGGNDGFVAKLNSSGEMVWNTFLGGSGQDRAYKIAVDGSGNVIVIGDGTTTWGNPIQAFSGSYDAFVAKLNSNGTLLWNTFLGSSGNESTDAYCMVTVDSSGNIYATGSNSAGWGTPVRAYSGSNDAFVVKLNPSGTLIWNTYLGGSAQDTGDGIAVDGSGNVVVSGYSGSTWGAPVRVFGGGDDDAFVAKLNSSGALLWNTFLGSNGEDRSSGVVLDGSGNIYVSGISFTSWGTPVRAYYGSGEDAFIAKLSPSGVLTWNTFLGSSGDDYSSGITLDGSGNVVVTGWSPASWGIPLQPYTGGGYDAFAAKLTSSGGLVSNIFLGGSGWDGGEDIVVDNSGNIYVAGGSGGSSWGTPLHAFGGKGDAFVAKVDLTPPPPGASTLISPLASVATGKPTFVWSKVTASTYYRLWIKNSGGTWVMQNLYYGQNICGTTNCAVTPAISLANGTYTWYIQTLTATQNGAWSAHAFTVAIPTPGASTLVAPKGITHIAKPTFIWSKDSVATLYRLWIKNNTTSAWVIQNLYAGKNICGVTNCAIVSPVSLANGSYTWYIDTLTATQNGQWSAQAITVSVPDEVPGGDGMSK